MPESGEMKARFIFDPVDADVHCVDFIGSELEKSHNTYGIFSGEIGETFGTAGLGVGKLVDDGRFETGGSAVFCRRRRCGGTISGITER